MADLTPEALDALQEHIAQKAAMIQMGEKIKWGSDTDALNDANAAITALRAQLATAQKEIDRCHARLEITHEWRAEETGEWVKVPVADPAAHPDAVYCRDATIELMQDQIETLERRLATARAEAVRVKPLVWRNSYGVLRSESPLGDYKVAGKILYHPNSLAVQSVHDSTESAKAAAQADYEARILAALEPTPSAPSPEAVARAAMDAVVSRLAKIAKYDDTGDAAFDEGWMAACLEAATEIRSMQDDDPTLAAIVAKAGGGE